MSILLQFCGDGSNPPPVSTPLVTNAKKLNPDRTISCYPEVE